MDRASFLVLRGKAVNSMAQIEAFAGMAERLLSLCFPPRLPGHVEDARGTLGYQDRLGRRIGILPGEHRISVAV